MPDAKTILENEISFMKEHNLSNSELVVLNHAGRFRPESRQALIHSIRSINSCCDKPSPSRDSLNDAIDQLLRKKLVQDISSDSLTKIREELPECDRFFVNLDGGLPNIGDVDLAEKGAVLFLELYQSTYSDRQETPICSYILEEETLTPTIHSSDRCYAENQVYSFMVNNPNCHLLSCSNAKFVGPWFERWWLQHPEGWEIRMKIKRLDK